MGKMKYDSSSSANLGIPKSISTTYLSDIFQFDTNGRTDRWTDRRVGWIINEDDPNASENQDLEANAPNYALLS